jgi:phosphoglycolate phosphatase
MRYSLVIFDLDGTLADSFPWFLHNLNAIADRFGFRRIVEDGAEPVLSELGQELRRSGSREIVGRLHVPRWKLPLIARHIRRLKAAHAGDVPLFPGAVEMLRALRHHGLILALVSSDSEDNVRRQLGAGNAALFSHFSCGASLFGKAAKFRRVLRRAGVDRGRALSIGDEVRDIEAARAVGIACAAVTWGYAAPEALIASAPDLVFEQVDDIRLALAADR